MLEKPEFDNTKVEAFARKLLKIINGGCLSLMVSVGHKTGLFDTLADLQTPSTSEEICKESKSK